MDEFNKYADLIEELAKSTIDVVQKFKKGMPIKTSRSKRTYKFVYVESILRNAQKPLHVDEIIDIARKQYNVSISKDSLSSAISKKIRSEGNISRTAPNTFVWTEV